MGHTQKEREREKERKEMKGKTGGKKSEQKHTHKKGESPESEGVGGWGGSAGCFGGEAAGMRR